MVKFEVNSFFDTYDRQKVPVITDNENPIDQLQSSFECCGTSSKYYWYKKLDYEGYKDHLPLSCCRKTVGNSPINSTIGITCGKNETLGSGIPFSRSCQRALNDFLKFYTGLLADILIFAAVLKIIAAYFAYAFAKVVQ